MNSRDQIGAIRGPFEVMLLGAAMLAAGVLRFVLRRHFGLVPVFFCLAAIPAAVLLLMILDYTLHHARIVALLVLAILLFWVIVSPSFSVGAGIALLIMVMARWP